MNARVRRSALLGAVFAAWWGAGMAVAENGRLEAYDSPSASHSRSADIALSAGDWWPEKSPSLGSVQPGALQDDPDHDDSADAAPRDGWQLEATPFLWAMQLDGNLTVEGLDASVDYSFSDLFDHLDFAGMVQVQAQYDRLIFEFDGVYAKLSVDDGVDLQGDLSVQRRFIDFNLPVEVDLSLSADIELGIAQFYVGYELVNEAVGARPDGGAGPRLVVAPYAGVRYTYFDTTMSLRLNEDAGPFMADQSFRFDQSEDWIDPVIGVNVGLLDHGKYSISARADVGGFGIANGSDLVWSAGVDIGYELTPNVTLAAGYHVLDYDYRNGSGSDAFKLDAQLRGPVLGVRIRF